MSDTTTLLLRRRRAGGAAPFSPSDISGLVLWLQGDGTLWQDSARTTPVTTDADPVGAWDDASGGGRHVIQATSGSRPTWQTNEINSEPVVRGDGSDDSLSGSDTGMPSGTSNRSAFLVIRPSANPASGVSNIILWWGSNSTNEGMGWSYVKDSVDGDKLKLRQFSWGGANVGGEVGDINGVTKLLSGIWNGTNGIVRVNGVQTESAAQSQNTTLSGTMYVFREPSGFTQRFAGDIAEIVVYDSALTGGDLTNIETYLMDKYGL